MDLRHHMTVPEKMDLYCETGGVLDYIVSNRAISDSDRF